MFGLGSFFSVCIIKEAGRSMSLVILMYGNESPITFQIVNMVKVPLKPQ